MNTHRPKSPVANMCSHLLSALSLSKHKTHFTFSWIVIPRHYIPLNTSACILKNKIFFCTKHTIFKHKIIQFTVHESISNYPISVFITILCADPGSQQASHTACGSQVPFFILEESSCLFRDLIDIGIIIHQVTLVVFMKESHILIQSDMM